MIGATVTAPRNATQPLVKPIRLPKAYCGNRALPPATGTCRELGVGEGEQHHRAAADQPRDRSPRPASDEAKSAAEPARPDDRAERGEEEPTSPTSRRSLCAARSGAATKVEPARPLVNLLPENCLSSVRWSDRRLRPILDRITTPALQARSSAGPGATACPVSAGRRTQLEPLGHGRFEGGSRPAGPTRCRG